MKHISIIIPVFNHLDYTKRCIESLNGQLAHSPLKNSKWTLVVIDDGSTDGTSDYLAEHHPEVEVCHGDGNLWWSGGAVMGVKHSLDVLKVDYILLWNNDVFAADDYFSVIDRMLPALPEEVVVGSKIRKDRSDGPVWSYGGVFNARTGLMYMRGDGRPGGVDFNEEVEADWLPGMGTLFPASVFADIGFWDQENFPQYHGDSDFTVRTSRAGYKLMVYPDLLMWNDTSTTGYQHDGTLKGLHKALTSIKSNTRIKTNVAFLRKHATSPMAYFSLVGPYFKMIAGFIKWNVLGWFGMKKKK